MGRVGFAWVWWFGVLVRLGDFGLMLVLDLADLVSRLAGGLHWYDIFGGFGFSRLVQYISVGWFGFPGWVGLFRWIWLLSLCFGNLGFRLTWSFLVGFAGVLVDIAHFLDLELLCGVVII